MFVRIGELVKPICRQVLTVTFLLSHVLIPLGVMSFYFVSSSMLLPAGVNKVFVTRSAKYSVPIAILLCIALFAVFGSRRIRQQLSRTSREELSAGDLILLLLPLAPVVQYILNNNDILSRLDSILVFCFFALLASLPIIVVPMLLRSTGSARLVMYLGVALAFSITNMASLSKQFAWHEWGSLKIQLPVFAGVWLASWLLFRLGLRRLLYLMIAVCFLANSILQLHVRNGTLSSSDPDQTHNRLVVLVDSKEPVVTPSIYLLVYDSYVASETMSAYGIDNRVQEQYLKELGFKLYPHTYSVGALSIATMSRVLNCSASFYGNPRRGVSGDGIVQNLLEELGYKSYGVFPTDYFFRGVVPSYDYSFPGYGSSASLLVEAILEGEFRFDIDFDEVSEEEFVQEKEGVLSQVSEESRFIYTHSRSPGHSQGSGVCLPNQVELYGEALVRANLEMRHDIEMIIENDPKGIVIVAGDHGPYLTKNCMGTDDAYDISEISRLDIQDRLATFLAIRWPSEDFEEYDDITVLQDLFPAVFAYIFADPGLLESRVGSTIQDTRAISGANVVDGVIMGGIHNGQPLFTSR
ncbi:MAG: hypothetical protein NTU91_08765 [Chloroflexi bacterium]|nr:hypothetical protein [Chloroflexota bacterium]